MLDHPKQLTKEFISNLFNREESYLDSFEFEPVGSGQVGDCYRINLNWNDIKDSPTSLIAKCPAEEGHTVPGPLAGLPARVRMLPLRWPTG